VIATFGQGGNKGEAMKIVRLFLSGIRKNIKRITPSLILIVAVTTLAGIAQSEASGEENVEEGIIFKDKLRIPGSSRPRFR